MTARKKILVPCLVHVVRMKDFVQEGYVFSKVLVVYQKGNAETALV